MHIADRSGVLALIRLLLDGEEESVKVRLRREDSHCRSKWSVGVNQIAAGWWGRKCEGSIEKGRCTLPIEVECWR